MTFLKTKRTCGCSSRSYIPEINVVLLLDMLIVGEHLSFYIKEYKVKATSIEFNDRINDDHFDFFSE